MKSYGVTIQINLSSTYKRYYSFFVILQNEIWYYSEEKKG